MEEIGTNVRHWFSAEEAELEGGVPDWFAATCLDLEKEDLGAEWSTLVGAWRTLEEALVYGRLGKVRTLHDPSALYMFSTYLSRSCRAIYPARYARRSGVLG